MASCQEPRYVVHDDLLNFSSKNHAFTLLGEIGKIRNRRDFCDIRIRVGNEVYHCHRVVMAACSPYFNVMFSGGLSEATKSEVEIHDVQSNVFGLIIDFIYTGKYIEHIYILSDCAPLDG